MNTTTCVAPGWDQSGFPLAPRLFSFPFFSTTPSVFLSVFPGKLRGNRQILGSEPSLRLFWGQNKIKSATCRVFAGRHVVRVYGTKASKMSQRSVTRVCGSPTAGARCQEAPLACRRHSLAPSECREPTRPNRLDAALAVELQKVLRRRACHRRRPVGGGGV